MNLCSDGHDEIAHEGNYDKCPICELIKEKDEEIEDLKNEIEDHKETIVELREMLEEE